MRLIASGFRFQSRRMRIAGVWIRNNGGLWNGPRAHFLFAKFTNMRNEELTQLLIPVVADMGLECLGVEYSPSQGNGLVRVYIDAVDRAVTVEDCEVVSRQVSATLDVNDPVAGRYTLEVSSPGLDRPLYTPEQFARVIGNSAKLEVNLAIDGRRRFQGLIVAVNGNDIVIEQDGQAVTIAGGNIHKARLIPDFGDQAKAPSKRSKKSKDAKNQASRPAIRTQEQLE